MRRLRKRLGRYRTSQRWGFADHAVCKATEESQAKAVGKEFSVHAHLCRKTADNAPAGALKGLDPEFDTLLVSTAACSRSISGLATHLAASKTLTKSSDWMGEPAAEEVHSAVQHVLDTSDWQTITGSQVVEQVATRLGQGANLSAWKEQIDAHIEDYITLKARQQYEDEKKDVGQKRSATAPAASPGSMKKVKAAMPAGNGEDGYALNETGLTRCAVREFKGKTYVDLRTFYEKEGQRYPSKRGIMLPSGEWQSLANHLPDLTAALANGETDCLFELTSTRRATVSDFKKGELKVDVREWYEKDGDMKPGQKGVSLSSAAFEALLEHAEAISSQMAAASTATEAGDTKRAVKTEAGPSLPAASAPAAAVAAVVATPPPGIETMASGTGETLYKLSGSKFAGVSVFKGKKLANLREYYQKDGQWLPGKKGISLQPEQFEKLRSAAEDITTAYQALDTSYSLELSKMRKVSVSCFKSKYYVNIREFYEKNGALAPGAKGIALDEEGWTHLTRVSDTLKQLLNSV